MALIPELIDRLRELDSSAVSDALDALGLPGATFGIRPLTVGRKVVGRAVTVELVPATPEVQSASTRHLCTAAVVASGTGDVIVVSHPGGNMAGWGGLLTKAASMRGIEGTLIDGCARDIDESAAFGYPIYGVAATAITARTRIIEKSWAESISFAGVAVDNGDLVIADGSGVVFIPRQRAEEVITKAEALATRERAIAAALDSGIPITEAMGGTYEHALSGEEH